MKAIIFAGSRGIGAAITESLSQLDSVKEIISLSSREVDTSNVEQVKSFCRQHPEADVLVLNTGGPPSKNFFQITDDEWQRYFNQLFLSFTLALRDIRIRDGGYCFLISSFNIKEPNKDLVLSNSFRLGFHSVFKSVSQLYLGKKVSFINIAPGPTETDRLDTLIAKSGKTFQEYVAGLPSKAVADPRDIGKFVKFIVAERIQAINGVCIPFDMGLGNCVL